MMDMQTVTGIAVKVFFEEPFWVAVFERVSEGKLSACKVTFGAEPKDYEINSFILKHYDQLRFSPDVTVSESSKKLKKRIKYVVERQLKNPFIGTNSQQALKLQHEQIKSERKTLSREQREAQKQRLFDLKQQKRKEKHKGR